MMKNEMLRHGDFLIAYTIQNQQACRCMKPVEQALTTKNNHGIKHK
jgi:hypothetical protein